MKLKQFLSRNAFLISCLVIVGLLFVMAKFVTPVYRIDSGSMEPTLPVGTYIVTLPTEQLNELDIITFKTSNGVVTHTFLGYNSDGSLITHGDANPSIDVFDKPLMQSDVLGKVILVNIYLAPGFWLSLRGMLTFGVIVVAAAAILWFRRQDKKSQKLDVDTVSEETRELNPV